MKQFIAIAFILSSLTIAAGESKDHYKQLFELGNQYYSENKFDSATIKYNEIIGAGYQSSELFFNLGNAYYKSGKMPQAILFYERAKKLAPADEDVKFNLEMANQQITDKIEPVPQLFYQKWLSRLVQSSPADNWAIMAISFLFIGLALLAFFYLANTTSWKKLFFSSSIFVLAFAGIAYICASSQYHNEVLKEEAIVFAPTVNILSAPKENSTQLFVVHEGTKVQVLETINTWQKISLANGNIGWVKSEMIEII